MWAPFESLTDRFVRWLDRIAEDGLMRLSWWKVKSWFGARLVQRKLVAGEVVLTSVKHSMVIYIPWVLLALVGFLLAVLWVPSVPVNMLLIALIFVVAVLGFAFFKLLYIARDRFVVTDSRVFRVWGLFTLNEAEMELPRVLDITVQRPWWLRIFVSGHIILENAAQDQGLREIHYVPKPEDITMVIHRQRRIMSGFGAQPDTPEEKPPPPTRRRPDHPRSPGPVTARRQRIG